MRHLHQPTANSRPPFWRSRHGVAFLVVAAVAAYFLFKEHTAHVAGYLPFLLLAACLLMHLFLHGGHGAQDQEARAPEQDATAGKIVHPREERP